MAESESAGLETGILSHYGKPIAEYQGRGSMTLEDGRQMQCTFVAGQLAAGNVLLLCEFQEFILEFHPVAKTFEGTTDKGHRVSAQRGENGRGITWYPFLPDRAGCWHAFCVWELKVEMAGGVAETKAVRFGLTNLTFCPQGPDKSGQSCLRLILESASDPTELSIVPLPGYDKIVEFFRISGTTDLTSEVVIDTTKTTNTEHLENVVDNLCHLLSVARGTLIQWIYLDFYDGKERCFERRHYSRRTKPYNSLELLDSNQPAETKEFLQQSYKTYVAKRNSYRVHKGLIASYLEAKASDDTIERRGIKLAVTLEMLKTVYLEQPENIKKEYVVDEEKFKPLISGIQDRVREILKNAAVQKDLSEAICAEEKLLGLNRRSFRYVLEKLCGDINLDAAGDQRKLFIKCRNSLIHKGRFYCTTATPEERIELPPKPTMLDEFSFMLNFVDRIFLKLLGYDGPYRDWSSLENSVRREQVNMNVANLSPTRNCLPRLEAGDSSPATP